MSCCGVWRLAAVYVLLWCVVLWWVLLGCVLLWCDVVLCYAVLYGRRNLTKNPSLKLSGKTADCNPGETICSKGQPKQAYTPVAQGYCSALPCTALALMDVVQSCPAKVIRSRSKRWLHRFSSRAQAPTRETSPGNERGWMKTEIRRVVKCCEAQALRSHIPTCAHVCSCRQTRYWGVQCMDFLSKSDPVRSLRQKLMCGFSTRGNSNPTCGPEAEEAERPGSANFLANENASSRCDVGHAGGRDVLKMRVALLDRMETNREEQV